jgi:hypothetical protein
LVATPSTVEADMSRKCTRPTAVTLTEVTVCGSLLLMAAAVMGPALTKPRSVGQRTDCLSNLQRIGVAMHQYAAEDPHEQAIPIHMGWVHEGHVIPDYYRWLGQTANWFAWGGQSATLSFRVSSYAAFSLSETIASDCGPPWDCRLQPEYAASRRPLNGYILPEPLDVFHCPADTGYPPNLYVIDPCDSPPANALRPCWDTLGNSYRVPRTIPRGDIFPQGEFSVSAYRHRLSTLQNQSQLVMLGDPVWYAMIGHSEEDPPPVGWHGVTSSDNVLFCDGSARMTSVRGGVGGLGRRPLSSDSLERTALPVYQDDWLCAGPGWQLDCYPAPGAVVYGDWSYEIQHYSDRWPWRNAYLNP